jgi:hypothetical protein
MGQSAAAATRGPGCAPGLRLGPPQSGPGEGFPLSASGCSIERLCCNGAYRSQNDAKRRSVMPISVASVIRTFPNTDVSPKFPKRSPT